MLYLEHCIISINNSNFHISIVLKNIMENGPFAPQEQMLHFSYYFKNSYISKSSNGACVE